MKKKTAFSYIRISTEDQSNFSISGQQLLNEEYAKRNGIEILKTFTDDGYSAKDFNRPAWRDLEKELTKNKVDYLIVMKYDRLIRDVLEGLMFVNQLEKKLNITLLSVMENYNIDPNDPYFFKTRAGIFVDAEFERLRISDRTKMGLWSGRSQGYFLSKAPFGYDNVKDEKGKSVIVINPVASNAIRGIFDDFLNDYTFSNIEKRARERGFSLMGADAIKRVIMNSTYAGMVKVSGYKEDAPKLIKGLHEAIIPENVYWNAYYKLQEKIKPQGPKIIDENLPLRGFLLCQHCGIPLTGAKCKGKRRHYYYYWCNSCRGANYSAIKAHNDIGLILQGLSLKPYLIEAYEAETMKELDLVRKERKEHLDRVSNEMADINKKLSSIEEKYINDAIELDTYQKWHSFYTKELNEKGIIVSDLKKDCAQVTADQAPYLKYLGDLNFVYQKADIPGKQQLLRGIFPGCLIAQKNGYRTPYLVNVLTPNSLLIGSLVQIKNTGKSSYLENFPVGVDNGIQNEHLLKVIANILKVA